MTQPGTVTPYSSYVRLMGDQPSWVPPLDAERVGTYIALDEMYWNESQKLDALLRGAEGSDEIIKVPVGKKIVDTLHRYIGARFGYVIDQVSGTPASRTLADNTLRNLFARERFFSKYNANKKFGILRGDWLWHIVADPTKPEGTRLSILTVHPGNYFPVFESDIVAGGDPDKIVKIHLAEITVYGEDTVIRRQTYEKVVPEGGGPATIYSSLAYVELEDWNTDKAKPVNVVLQPTALPPDITSFPVYHIKNMEEPGNPFGSSALRGYLDLISGVTQSFTDEDLTLALEGLGVYATDSPTRPIDPETGNPTNWIMGPGRVVHNAEGLRRIPGAGSVAPYGDHIDRMMNELKETSGANDAAIGQVDVSVAESGVALALRLSPILNIAEEQDQHIGDVHAQMFHDLKTWLRVFEGVNIDDVIIMPVFGDKLPKNIKAAVEIVTALTSTSPPVLSAVSARRYLASQGLDIFDEKEADLVAAEQAEAAERADPFGARAGGELGADSSGSEGGSDALEAGEGEGA